ncbi:ribosomal protein S16, partial [Acaromyces ingoldii]
MVVRLRLARHGTRNNPFYHIVAIRDSKPRDARPIEKLGEYDPIPRPRVAVAASAAGTASATSSADASSSSSASSPGPVLTSGIESGPPKLEKRIEWNAARIKYWLDTGAQPSKPVAKLLDRAGLVPPGKTYKGIYKPP